MQLLKINNFLSLFSLILFLTAFIHLSSSSTKIALSGYTQDFQQYYEAALMIKENLNPYQRLLTSSGPFNYPPPVLMLIYPLSLLNLKTGLMIWTMTSFAAYLLSLYLCFRLIGIKMPLWLKLLTIAFLLEFFPLKFTLGMGQINNFVLLFLVLSLIFLKTKQTHVLAGVFFGLATIIKISPAIFIPYLFLKKKWATLSINLLSIIILLASSYLWLGQKIHTMYQYIFFNPLNFIDKAVYYNQSALSFFSRTFKTVSPLKTSYVIFLIAIITATVFALSKKSKSISLDFCLILPLMLILSPISWQHHFVLLIPVFIILAAILFLKKAKKSFWLFLLLAYLLVSLNLKSPSDWPFFIQSHVFYGTFLVWLLSFFISTADQGNSTQLTVDLPAGEAGI